MKRNILLLAAAAGTLIAATGCVSKKKFADLEQRHSALQTQYADLMQSHQGTEVMLVETRTENKSLEQRLADEQRRNADLRRDLQTLQGSLDRSIAQNSQGNVNISKLVDEINASNRYIKQLVEAKSKSDSLNMVLTNNLTRSLSRDELQEVDVRVLKGVVYISLADNMLYRSGSYEINERGQLTLSKIAKIIKDYGEYDVLVEGNTDPVPISRTNIRNNWDLSCLRASSVVIALQELYGVDPARLTAGGRGEYNPIADNSSELGRQRNRRTQIIVTPKLDQFLDLIDKAPETGE
ncbi:MAG: OmpA family protein [Alloprevotella sp.]|nr:OmpA family protein [Alloprevotella sp.]